MSVAKIMISLPPGLLEEVDQAAKAEQRSRSEFVREALRMYLLSRQSRRRPGDDPVVQRAIAHQDEIARMDTIPWDGVAEIRRWRDQH